MKKKRQLVVMFPGKRGKPGKLVFDLGPEQDIRISMEISTNLLGLTKPSIPGSNVICIGGGGGGGSGNVNAASGQGSMAGLTIDPTTGRPISGPVRLATFDLGGGAGWGRKGVSVPAKPRKPRRKRGRKAKGSR